MGARMSVGMPRTRSRHDGSQARKVIERKKSVSSWSVGRGRVRDSAMAIWEDVLAEGPRGSDKWLCARRHTGVVRRSRSSCAVGEVCAERTVWLWRQVGCRAVTSSQISQRCHC